MQCIFAFLSLTELVQTARCCVQWNKWATKPMGRTDIVQLRHKDHFHALATSRMCAHVASVQSNAWTGVNDINHLWHATTITTMAIYTDYTDQCNVDLDLPRSLTDLSLKATYVISAFVEIFDATSIRRLQLHCVRRNRLENDAFDRMLRLTNLETLVVNKTIELNEHHLRVIKQMPSIRSISLLDGWWPLSYFETLCSPPHVLNHLETIALHDTYMTEGHVWCLQHIPTLTELCPRMITNGAIRQLHRFLPPACRKLHINRSYWDDMVTLDTIDTIDFSRIATLRIEQVDMSSDAAVYFACAKLRSVTTLSLEGCNLPADLSRLHLPNLHTLEVVAWDDKRHFTRAQLTGMPELSTFKLSV